MNTEIAAKLIVTAISAVGLWYGFFFLYKEHTVNEFRHRMFALRDQLFDEAAAGLIPFNHPAYGMIRITMNGFIRFGHRISLFELAVSYFVTNKDKSAVKSYFSKLSEAMKSLDQETADKLRSYQARMIQLVLIQAFAASPVFLFFLLAYFVPVKLVSMARNKLLDFLSRLLAKPIDSIEAAAFVFGK